MPKKSPIASLPKLKGLGKPKKPPAMKRFAIRPRGPEHLKLGVIMAYEEFGQRVPSSKQQTLH